MRRARGSPRRLRLRDDRRHRPRGDVTARVPAGEMAVRFGAVAARNRDVELGIAPHAVLGDVEPERLRVLLDPDAPDLVHPVEEAEADGEDPDADDGDAERLHAELVEAARVDEAAR